ncbi:MAG TPA: ABC transporter ATP-binding protein [Xanthobacteraceae bacterium]|jgi:branched-chain amino acid transport system ATP-binding protein
MTGPVLEVADLHKRFGGLEAAAGINLAVRQGEFRALIGPNGAGKSTLFNLITGYLRADRGRVSVQGRDVTGLPAYRLFRRGVSRTFQISSVFSELTVLENLQVALVSYHRQLYDMFNAATRRHLAECERLIGIVGLAGERSRRAGALSHGDKKKLELAIALGNRPQLLLLDEPTAGMASSERLDSIRTVHRIVKELGVTVLFTEHDMRVVFSVADRITVLHQGRIIAEGSPEEIRRSARVQEIYLGESVGEGQER